MRGIVLSFFLVLIFFNSEKTFAGTVTMPSTLTSDTTDFVLLSSSGTTPSISGYTGTLLVLLKKKELSLIAKEEYKE